MKNRKGSGDFGKLTYVLLGIGLIVIAIIAYPQIGQKLLAIGGVQAPSAPTTPTIQPGCHVSTTDVSTTTLDHFNPGEGNKDVITLLYVNGKFKTEKSDQSDFTTSPGKKIEVVAYDDNNTNADPNADWYGQTITETLGCTGTETISFDLYKEGNVSTIVWNDDGSVNSASNPQTMNAGETYGMNIQFKGPREASFGDPYSKDANIVVGFNYSTDVIDSISVDGQALASVPKFDLGVAKTAYSLGVSSIANSEKKSYTITIKTDNTNAPGNENITGRLYDPALFINEKTGLPEFGIQDENGNDVGVPTGDSFTIYTA